MSVNRIIVQTRDGRIDLLTAEPGQHADHYLTVDPAEADEWIARMQREFPAATLTDYRAKA